jgi:hypothetical protein
MTSPMLRNRKFWLYGGLVVIASLYVGDWLIQQVLSGPLQEREARIEQLEANIETREQRLTEARRTAQQMELWEAQSLPSDVEVARSLYQAWLLELVGEVGLGNPNVDSSEPSSRKGLYNVLGFSVRGRGSLTTLTQFLHEFYRSPHLHQIRTISLSPVGNEGQLDLALTMEALSLPDATRRDQLAEGESERLLFAELEPYLLIARRNIFGTGGGFDPTEHAFLTAITRVDGRPLAWFNLRDVDETLQLAAGAEFQVGRTQLRLLRIEQGDVLLEAKGEYWLVSVGESVAQAVAIPEEFVLDAPGDEPGVAAMPPTTAAH